VEKGSSPQRHKGTKGPKELVCVAASKIDPEGTEPRAVASGTKTQPTVSNGDEA